MKTDGRNVDPIAATAMMFGICSMGWSIVFTILYYKFISKSSYSSNGYTSFVYILIWLVGYGLINNYYTSKERYLVIYKKYLSMETDKRRGPILLSFLFVLLPFILLGFYGLIVLLR